MASQKIDELQLQIGSDASDAIRQLGNLATALNIAATSASRLGGASGDLQRFASGIDRIGGVNFGKAIDNLTKLSRINLNNLKDKKVNIDISVSGADRIDRLKYAASQAERDVSRSVSAMGKSLGKDLGMNTDGIASVRGILRDITHDIAGGGDAAEGMERLREAISNSARVSTADLTGMRDAYVNFLQDVENLRINPGQMSKDEMAEWRKMGLERILKNGGMRIDTDVFGFDSAFAENNSSIIDFFTVPDNAPDQFVFLREKILEAKEALSGFTQNDAVAEKISTMAENTTAKIREMVETATSKHMTDSADKIPIDLDIDQTRFETQIQNAINKATGKEYTTQPIKLKIDNQKLRDAVEAAFGSIDIAKLPQFASGFSQVADAISTMNQVNVKDSGITQFTNSIKRLIDVDTSKFDVGIFRAIVTGITDISNVGDISNNLNRFVSSIARLANAGDKTKTSADGLRVLAPELKNAIRVIMGAGEINKSITQFVASLASLASAGDKASKTASNLSNLTDAVIEFLNALQSAPEINDNLAMTIHGLGNLAAAGQKTGKALDSVGSSGGKGMFGTAIANASHTAVAGLKKLLNVSISLGGRGAAALGTFMGRLGLIPAHTAHVNGMALSFGNLLRTILPFIGLRGVFGWLKESVNLGSSIVEIQNVIDTAFGGLRKDYEDISGYVYKWAKSTIDAFGVSEIAALKYAGRLQSIFNSSGFDLTEGMRDSAAKMTTDLIERAGDIASFYDITVDEAMTKITSGLAGMSRPLRSLGVNMSVANMQAFALSQGINTSWKEMDQATQMALRYQYILHATQYAEGDFQRTSMSLANQLRLLSLNFQVLSSTIGQGLVSAIAPAISWLNALIRRLIQAANAFRTFMWTLFGKPLAAARGFSDDLAGYLDDSADAVGDLGSGAGGASDGLGKAGKAAKELKKQLTVLPFDELNQLAKDTNSAGSGGSGGGGGGGGVGGLGGLDTSGLLPDFTADLDNSPVIDAINEWARRIRMAFVQRDWGKLGLTIADGINKGFKKLYDLLDWDKWKDKVYGFIQPFQATINSLVAGVDFDLIGRTLARGLNFITRTFRMWINGFNWRDWGKKLAEGMNGFFDEWDADSLGRAIADKFRAAWNFFGGWVSEFDFSQFGEKLKEGIHGAIDELNPRDMGESLGTFLTGIGETLVSLFKDGTLKDDFSEAFSEFLNGFLETFDAQKVSEGINAFVDTIVGGIGKAVAGADKTKLTEDFTTLLVGLPWGTIVAGIGAVAGGKFAASLLGTAFMNRARAILEANFPAIFGSGGTSGATAGAAAGATTASKSGTVTLGTITAATLGVTAITLGGIALGRWLDKNLRKMSPTYGKAADAQKNAKESGATGSSTSYSDVWKNFGQYTPGGGSGSKESKAQSPKGTSTTNTVKTVMKASVDTSMKQADTMVQGLKKDPVITKILKGDTKQSLITGSNMFHALMNGTATKTIMGKVNSSYATTETRYGKLQDGRATKTVYGSRTAGFDTTYTRYIAVKTEKATKKVTAEKTSQFDSILTKWNGFSDKWVKLHVQADLSGMVKKIRAWQSDNDYTNVLWTTIDYYAKGGLFTGPTGMAVFGEAGSEAAIPLERKSTMKKIASAIVDSGGFNTGTNSDLANDIAVRVAPIIMDAMASQNQRPINVNATLYTENNEVLAKAVNRGNRSLDKRYHPVAQYSY